MLMFACMAVAVANAVAEEKSYRDYVEACNREGVEPVQRAQPFECKPPKESGGTGLLALMAFLLGLSL